MGDKPNPDVDATVARIQSLLTSANSLPLQRPEAKGASRINTPEGWEVLPKTGHRWIDRNPEYLAIANRVNRLLPSTGVPSGHSDIDSQRTPNNSRAGDSSPVHENPSYSSQGSKGSSMIHLDFPDEGEECPDNTDQGSSSTSINYRRHWDGIWPLSPREPTHRTTIGDQDGLRLVQSDDIDIWEARFVIQRRLVDHFHDFRARSEDRGSRRSPSTSSFSPSITSPSHSAAGSGRPDSMTLPGELGQVISRSSTATHHLANAWSNSRRVPPYKTHSADGSGVDPISNSVSIYCSILLLQIS